MAQVELDLVLSKLEKTPNFQTVSADVVHENVLHSKAAYSVDDLKTFIKGSCLHKTTCAHQLTDVSDISSALSNCLMTAVDLETMASLWIAACLLNSISLAESSRSKLGNLYCRIFRLSGALTAIQIDYVAGEFLKQLKANKNGDGLLLDMLKMCRFMSTFSKVSKTVGVAVISSLVSETCGNQPKMHQPRKLTDIMEIVEQSGKLKEESSVKIKLFLVVAISFLLNTLNKTTIYPGNEQIQFTKDDAERLYLMLQDLANYGVGGYSRSNGVVLELMDLSEFIVLNILPILSAYGANVPGIKTEK